MFYEMGIVTALCQNLHKNSQYLAQASAVPTTPRALLQAASSADEGIEELFQNTCIALSVLSEEEIVAKTLRSLNVINHLVVLMNSKNEFTQIAAANVIANIRKFYIGNGGVSAVSLVHTAHLQRVLEQVPKHFPILSLNNNNTATVVIPKNET